MNNCPYEEAEQESSPSIGSDNPAIVVMLLTVVKIRYIRWSLFIIILFETLILERTRCM